jgi:hypothetical protein
MILEGKITNIYEIKEGVTKNGDSYKTIEFRVEETGEYPSSMKFQLFKKGDDVKWIDKFSELTPVNTLVRVEFNSKTSEHNGNVYNNVSAWKVDKLGSAPEVEVEAEEEGDSLPF